MSEQHVEFGSPEMLENPFPFFEEKRAHCPVFPVPARSMYVVTRHKDLEFVLRNPDIFSSEGRNPLVNFPGQRYKSTPCPASAPMAQI